MKRDDIQVLTPGQPAFPALLKEIRDCPKALYCIGRTDLLGNRCAAVIGSRTATEYGRNAARGIARCLASAGVTVVSGMARGIDTCAHEGALEEIGSTIAVLGCGPDICYPAENRDLKDFIEQKGLIISEYEPGTQPQPFRFPQRNRIISGLSELVVIAQARNRSGALITAELAAEQGRQLCAVPGNINSQYNLGSNKLIADGAQMITVTEDVLEFMGIRGRSQPDIKGRLSDTEFVVYRMLREGGEMSADELCLKTSFSAAYLNPILSALEIKGFIYSAAGKFFLANH